MSKAATKKSVTTTEDVIQRRLAVLEPKNQFFNSAFNMGWQLGGAVLIPFFIGVKLDDKFKTSPSFTLTAFVIACAGVVAVVKSTIKQVNQEQAEVEAEESSHQSASKEDSN